ncbi:MAG TPA: LysE family transporter [Ktedonobacteraceae bacterium]|jgi:threonine/homoserine/homoserine lactone efflux protein|nr:LysE family transporter [Ktedonobacteraceae bacterium]
MDASFFVRGLLPGLSIAAVVGPMSILCIHRTLDRGQRYGLVSGLGIATADGVYGSVAAFGLTVIASFLINQQQWIRLIGGLFLICLGLKAMFSKPVERSTGTVVDSLFAAYVSAFLLTLSSPMTILSFAAVFAGMGVGSVRSGEIAALLVVLGVFSGSALWWCLLTSGVNLLRRKVTMSRLRWINRGSGALLIAFGIVALSSIR